VTNDQAMFFEKLNILRINRHIVEKLKTLTTVEKCLKTENLETTDEFTKKLKNLKNVEKCLINLKILETAEKY